MSHFLVPFNSYYGDKVKVIFKLKLWSWSNTNSDLVDTERLNYDSFFHPHNQDFLVSVTTQCMSLFFCHVVENASAEIPRRKHFEQRFLYYSVTASLWFAVLQPRSAPGLTLMRPCEPYLRPEMSQSRAAWVTVGDSRL